MFSLLRTAPTSAFRTPLLTRSLASTPTFRSTQGYGSPKVSNPPPAENNPSGESPSGNKSDQQKSNEGGSKSPEKKAEEKDMPKPNADASESAGDKGKPHYKCDTETSGAKGEQELKKPEDK